MTRWNSRGHRGDVLEDLILLTHDYYHRAGLGRVDKVHVPIKVIEIDSQGIIKRAFFERKSTVDFIGVIQGIAVAFDVKETALKSFPLKNVHAHQVEYMQAIQDQKGLSFLIVHFKFCDEYYLIPNELLQYYYNAPDSMRKSIPYKSLSPEFKIERASNGILNYLPILNIYLTKKKEMAEASSHSIIGF